MPSADREARFRATHGMSSGAWYEMRRKAIDAGVKPSSFDKAARDRNLYSRIKSTLAAKREARKVKEAGGDTQRAINRIKDQVSDLIDLYPDIEVGWGTP